ncbi:hypothetical protein B7P43_G01984 [Cryptotermes secundus]|uniref:Uncharacterized protein n=1 Tax=Cryptotermes secundus TaxID=105785 RepID=A0A2J7Q967_9NEOP|nr:hypothetical protein B7P43_G01984 [Cryptotermes secundus]
MFDIVYVINTCAFVRISSHTTLFGEGLLDLCQSQKPIPCKLSNSLFNIYRYQLHPQPENAICNYVKNPFNIKMKLWEETV